MSGQWELPNRRAESPTLNPKADQQKLPKALEVDGGLCVKGVLDICILCDIRV